VYRWSEADRAEILGRPSWSADQLAEEIAAYEARKQEVEDLGKRVNRKVRSASVSAHCYAAEGWAFQGHTVQG